MVISALFFHVAIQMQKKNSQRPQFDKRSQPWRHKLVKKGNLKRLLVNAAQQCRNYCKTISWR